MGETAEPGRLVNQTELAEIVGVTDVTLWEWQKLGMPIHEKTARGKANTYNTADVIAWKIQFEVDKVRGGEAPKDRLARLQSEKLLRELQVLDGRLVPAEQIEPFLTAFVGAIASSLNALELKTEQHLQEALGIDTNLEGLRELFDEVRSRIPDDLYQRVSASIASGAGEADAEDSDTIEAAPAA